VATNRKMCSGSEADSYLRPIDFVSLSSRLESNKEGEKRPRGTRSCERVCVRECMREKGPSALPRPKRGIVSVSARKGSGDKPRNVQQFRGELVVKAHRLVNHSALGWKLIEKK
jgi:hypothetical protein